MEKPASASMPPLSAVTGKADICRQLRTDGIRHRCWMAVPATTSATGNLRKIRHREKQVIFANVAAMPATRKRRLCRQKCPINSAPIDGLTSEARLMR